MSPTTSHRCDVFVCYRRHPRPEVADRIHDILKEAGYRPFLDVRRTGTEPVEDDLRRHIREAKYFVPVFTPGCLDERPGEQDWMRWEIAEALRSDCRILPVYVPEFGDPSGVSLPPELGPLSKRNWVLFDHRQGRHAGAQLLDAMPVRLRRRRALTAVALVAGLGLLGLVLSRACGVASDEPLALDWLILGQGERGERWETFPVKEGSQLRSGDQFRVVFGLEEEAWVYVFNQTPQGRPRMLFPNRAIGLENPCAPGRLHEVPDGGVWFTLREPIGEERIYVLAAREPLERLEAAFEEAPFQADPEPVRRELDRLRSEAGERRPLRDVVLAPSRRWEGARLAGGAPVEGLIERAQAREPVLLEVRFQHLRAE